MRKIITKIICFSAAAVATLGIFSASACSAYSAKKLAGDISGEVTSQGGFAVGKGEYVYFINGKQVNTADNTLGTPVRGAIMRISRTDLESRNYSHTETVVPQIAYSGNNNGGLFIYGDYIYYATPSTEKNSDGEVQSSNLAFKRAKLDGSEVMDDYFVQYSDSAIEYRYVLGDDGVVYLLYVATGEDYYSTGSTYTNLHSVNTENGTNTLLAYNVDSVMFDSGTVSNPRVYYTMKVTDYSMENATANSKYNQIWTVTADETQPNEYDFSDLGDSYKPDENPLYVNCGDLVFDGIGKIENMTGGNTQFNGEGASEAERPAYTYTLSKYQDKNLFYTRTSTLISTASLYRVKDSEVTASGWKPVENNDTQKFILRDGSNASNYNYILDEKGDIENVIISDSNGFIKTGLSESGEIITDIDNKNCYYITKGSQPTYLFGAKHGDNNYIYYSLTGGNGYTVYRISYDGDAEKYSANVLPIAGDVNEYSAVRVLDLDCASDWYKPEMFYGQILFPSQTENMTDYPYIMACDLRVREDGKATDAVMTNAQLKILNDKYAEITERIDGVDSETFENLPNALKYAFFTNDKKYIYELCQAYVDILGNDYNSYWSEESLKAYDAFVDADRTGNWSEFNDKIIVNGTQAAANKRDYYYSLLGKMEEADAEAYLTNLKTTYLREYPVKEKTDWYAGLSTGAKVGFIIGVCAGGLLVIAAAVTIPLVIVKKRKEKKPEYTKKRIKVDTTDDRDIDVYTDDTTESK